MLDLGKTFWLSDGFGSIRFPGEEFEQPRGIDQGDTQIVWDRWFWGQGIFSKGTVEIFTNGQSVARGAFSGASSIMEQGDQGEFIFYNDAGDVVAIATQDELAPAIIEILETAGIGG